MPCGINLEEMEIKKVVKYKAEVPDDMKNLIKILEKND